MEKKVAIIILNFNNKDVIKNCLISLRKNTSYKNYKVIISDNGSTDGSIKIIKENFRWANLIENGKNLGFAGGNNIGVKYAMKRYKADYYLLLNNDTEIIQKDWLNKLVEAAELDEKTGVVGCKLIYPDKSLQFFAIKGRVYMLDKGEKQGFTKEEKKEADKIQQVEHIIGADFLIKKKVIEKIGLLDPDFFPIYGEEIDYCERVRTNGFNLVYTPKATIIHLRSQTTDPKKISNHWFFSKKNSIMLELLNYSISKIIYWQLIHFGAIFLGRDGKKIFFRWNFPERFILLLKAYFTNLKKLPTILYKRKHRDQKIW